MANSKPALLRQLGLISATALVISNMIGQGIFTTSGFLAGDLASPKIVMWIWIVGGVCALLGAIWGIWVHWYPLRSAANVQPVTIETATLYIFPAMVIVGLLVLGIAPRFRFFREDQLELKWWEAIVAGLPLFVALVVGMF